MRDKAREPVIIGSQIIRHNAPWNMIEYLAELCNMPRLNQKLNSVVSAIFFHAQINKYPQVLP
jgi:hypothetical protein